MNMNFESPKDKPEGSRFEFVAKLFGLKLKVHIEDNNQPIDAKIDLENKTVGLNITPQDAIKGIKMMSDRISSGGEVKKITNVLRGWNDRLERASLEKDASDKVKKYAESIGQKEEEVLREIIEEIKKEEGDQA